MPLRKWIKSADFAIEGILHAARTQRHLRYHFYSAAAVLLLSYVFGVSRTEFMIISLSVIAVLLSEMFNTAIEGIVDIISPNHSEKARIVKDIAAGAVFVTAFGAAVVGYIVLSPYIRDIFYKGILHRKTFKRRDCYSLIYNSPYPCCNNKGVFREGASAARRYAKRPCCARIFGMDSSNIHSRELYRLLAVFYPGCNNRSGQGYNKGSHVVGGISRKSYGSSRNTSAV